MNGKRDWRNSFKLKRIVMDQIFNELSVSACYPNKYAAQVGMDSAIDVSLSLSKHGMSNNIRTTSDFKERLLANEYSVADWSRDKTGNKDKRRHFLTYATKSPYIENYYDEKEQNEKLFEFRFEQRIALGLGLAYLWNTSSISLDGDSRFINGHVVLSEYRVIENEESINDISVFTFSKTEQVEAHKDSIKDSLYSIINCGSDIIRNAKEMLPFLSFCPKAIDQIKGLRGSEQFFPEVLNHLFILNDSMREWSGGSYTLSLDFSTESPSTMSNKEYAQKRTFVCNDNIERQFRFHSKIKSANKRIYFFPQVENKLVHIGYVGDHLPTTKFPT